MKRLLTGLYVFVLLGIFGCDETETLRERGRAALQVGDYRRSMSLWGQVLDIEPTNLEARKGLALSLFSEASDWDTRHQQDSAAPVWLQASRELDILLHLDSSANVRAMASTSLFHSARLRMDDDRLEDALSILNESIRLDSLNWFAWNLKGLVLEGLDKPESAQSLYEHVLAQDSSFLAAYINLGNLHWNKKHYQEACNDWSLGLKRDPENVYLRQWVERVTAKLKEKSLLDSER